MAIDNIIDAVTSGQVDTATSITISHTCDALAKILVVCSHAEDATPAGNEVITGITYAGSALTKITSNSLVGGTDIDSVELWYIVGPASGANNYVITYTGTVDGIIAGAISLFNVDTANPIDSFNSGSGTTSPENTSTTTVRGGVLVIGAILGATSSTAITSAAGQTQRYNVTNTGNMRGAMATKVQDAPGSSTIGWTSANQTWVQAVVSIAILLPPELYKSKTIIKRNL